MMAPRAIRVLALAALAACSSGASNAGSNQGGPPPATKGPCADGFVWDGTVCRAGAPATCGPGTAPLIGDAACVPVGMGACPAPFVPDVSGQGCSDPEPATCGANGRATIEGTCEPIGDCARAFPPSDASLFVDDSFTTNELDATHFKNVGDALEAASSGATIAIAEGSYKSAMNVLRPVRLVGHCAAKVVIEPLSARGAGIVTGSVKGLHVEGITLRGQTRPIALFKSAEATVEDVVIDGAFEAAVYVERATLTMRGSKVVGTQPGSSATGAGASGVQGVLGSQVTVERSELDGGTNGLYAGGAKAVVTGRELVIHGQAAITPRPSGALGIEDGKVVVERSVIRDLDADGGAVGSHRGIVELKDSVVRDVRYPNVKAYGHGLLAHDAGKVIAERTSVLRAASVGLLAKGKGSSIEARQVTIIGPDAATPDVGSDPSQAQVADAGSGAGAMVSGGASMSIGASELAEPWVVGVHASGDETTLDVRDTFIRDVRPINLTSERFAMGQGIIAATRATVTLDRVTVDHAVRSAFAAAESATVDGRRFLARRTRPSLPSAIGAGLVLSSGAQVTFSESSIEHSSAVGILSVLDGDGPSVKLTKSSIVDTEGFGTFGHGITLRGGAQAWLENVYIASNALAGLIAQDASVWLGACVLANNPVAIDAQGETTVVESNEASIEERRVKVSSDTRFVDNDTRVGAGTLALPSL